MQPSGIDAAIRELDRDVKRLQEVIATLKRIQAERVAKGLGGQRARRRLSAKARRRISQAAKKRWAALRASKG